MRSLGSTVTLKQLISARRTIFSRVNMHVFPIGRKIVWMACAALGAVLANPGPGIAEDWPMWRGPRGDGVSQEISLPTRWNAQTGEYGDLYKWGIIDPAKVVRTAIEDAASVAGLLITTEAMIAEKPKKEAAPAMPSGMDY